MSFKVSNIFGFFFTFTLFTILNVNSSYASNKILNVRASKTKETNLTRIVFETSEKPVYKSFIIKDPYRLVVDIKDGLDSSNLNSFKFDNVVQNVRINQNAPDNLRIVFDLYGNAQLIRSFNLNSDSKHKNYRIVVDIEHTNFNQKISSNSYNEENEKQESFDSLDSIISSSDIMNDSSGDVLGSLLESQGIFSDISNSQSNSLNNNVVPMPSSVRSRQVITNSNVFEPILFKKDAKRKYEIEKQSQLAKLKELQSPKNTYVTYSVDDVRKRKPIIIIDAGHGGKDPGAIGRRRTKEKLITLSFAKDLRSKLLQTGKYKVYLSRSGDYFISLGGRVKKAKQLKADLFISLHADYSSNKRTRGLSVYTLSQTASDKRTAQLASKENKADIIAGANFKGEYQDTIKILLDLSRRDTMNSSVEFAELSVAELSKNIKLLQNTHRYAGFAVLTAPDVPSVLIELGFLSNSSDERMLKTSSYRNKVNEALSTSIERFFRKKGYF